MDAMGQRGLERSGDTVVRRCHRLSRLLEVVVTWTSNKY